MQDIANNDGGELTRRGGFLTLLAIGLAVVVALKWADLVYLTTGPRGSVWKAAKEFAPVGLILGGFFAAMLALYWRLFISRRDDETRDE